MTSSDPIVFVAGARPNFVKVAPILRELGARSGAPQKLLVHTGQHYDFAMSGVFFQQLAIPEPDAFLQVGSLPHGAQTGAIMHAFEAYLLALPIRPRGVVVVGDVNSTMAAALVAAKLAIPLAHVEAGLRSFDRTMPEEINRVVTDAVADLLLVSEPAGLENLRREGVPDARVHYVGNVMIDSLAQQLRAARSLEVSAKLGMKPHSYAVVTLHRPSNVDSPARLTSLIGFIQRLAQEMPVIFPVHPRTRTRIESSPDYRETDRLRLLEPLGYREFVSLIDSARVVVSDSGGVQEETTWLGVPCVTMRENTERPITVSAGTNVLVGADLDAAFSAAVSARRSAPRSVEGWDGAAAARIVDVLLRTWA